MAASLQQKATHALTGTCHPLEWTSLKFFVILWWAHRGYSFANFSSFVCGCFGGSSSLCRFLHLKHQCGAPVCLLIFLFTSCSHVIFSTHMYNFLSLCFDLMFWLERASLTVNEQKRTVFLHIMFTFYYFTIQNFNLPVQHDMLIHIGSPPGSYLVDPLVG